jgi:asparagine synthase (glutamine-hydrolysing)
MTPESAAIAFPVNDFLGYWGTGNPQICNHQLQQVLTQTVPFQPQWFKSSPIDGDHAAVIWGVGCDAANGTWPGLQPASSQSEWASVPASLQLGISIAGFAAPLAWDASVTLTRDRLTLQRDGFGRMPLYWLQTQQVIWFASRWQWLLPLCDRPTLNLPAAYGYACFSYIPTPLTPITDITALPAGTQQTWTLAPQITAHTPQITCSWQECHDPIQDETIAIAQLQTLLQTEIQAQTADLTEEPVGVFLSGGLDSSIVAALLVQAGVKVRAYTLTFGTSALPELPYAAEVAEFLNIPLVTVEVTPRMVREALRPTAQALDLPFGDGVTVPFYLLAQAASQEVKIVFNGEGGDQLFAGWTNKPLIAAGVYQPEQPQAEPFDQQYLRTFHRLWGYEKQVFQPEVWPQIASLNPTDWLQEALDESACPSLLHQLRRATLMLKGAQNIHPRATALGRAHGLQVRSPFCSPPLAEWAFRVSSDLHLQGSCEKYILKRAIADWLPPSVVWRTKRGMGVPLNTWCLQELWHDLGTWLNPAQLQQDGIWHPQIANQIATGQLGTIQGRRVGECLWLLLMWQVWRQTVLGKTEVTWSLNHPFWLPPWVWQRYRRFSQQSP